MKRSTRDVCNKACFLLAWKPTFLCNAAAAAHRICQVDMLPTARWKARDIRSAVAAAGCFFLRKIKKIHCAQRAHARNCLHRLVSLAAAGLNKRLLMLPTARWKARDFRSAVAAAGCFFLRKIKKGLGFRARTHVHARTLTARVRDRKRRRRTRV